MKLSKRTKKVIIAAVSVIVLAFLCSLTAFADGEVAGAVESTWNAAKGQIKTIVNNVVFPVVDVILAILLFVKIATSYMDYRKHGQFEWTAPAILFGCLIFSLTARCIYGVLWDFKERMQICRIFHTQRRKSSLRTAWT